VFFGNPLNIDLRARDAEPMAGLVHQCLNGLNKEDASLDHFQFQGGIPMSEYNHVVEKDGEVFVDKVNNAISNMEQGKKEQILKDFEEFKSYLGKRIELGANIGLGEEQMAMIAEKAADYLTKHEEPRNSEEKLLQQLWKTGTQEEQHKLAHMLVRLAQSAN
jgi:hypothetical protein